MKKEFPTGATPSPRSAIAAAKPHQILTPTPATCLYNPKSLSYWGNNVYNDCVTAEESFAKACNSPEIFIPEQLAIDWATDNNFRDGANIYEVLVEMTRLGFPFNGVTYNDGSISSIDWTNSSTLQNSISIGPVKIGVASQQLQRAHTNSNGWFGLNFLQESIFDHCVSLCGFGTITWLAQQFNVQVPHGVNGLNGGYALFTWGTIGIIDQNSMIAITNEAWLRNPTSVSANCRSMKLQALGGETGHYLSHANNNLSMQPGYQGGGEAWIVWDKGSSQIAIECLGAEAGRYLSHAFGNIGLQPAYQGSGELWLSRDMGSGNIAIECLGGEAGQYLSHAYNNACLQPTYQGSGELWLNTGRY